MEIKSEIMRDFIKELLDNGFKVYYYERERGPLTDVLIEKDNKIGYIQQDYFSGCLHFDTVHKPNRNVGTGFRMNDEPVCNPTIRHAESTFAQRPHWASGMDGEIKKYKSFDEYRKYPVNAILKYAEINKHDIE